MKKNRGIRVRWKKEDSLVREKEKEKAMMIID